MAFIVYPTNIDYLIDAVRVNLGDYDQVAYKDSILRTSITNGIRMLQSRWSSKYFVADESTFLETLPECYSYAVEDGKTYVASGYIVVSTPHGYAIVPSGLDVNDVYRNPRVCFSSPYDTAIIQQDDEWPIILAATVMLFRARIASSSAQFQNWSDGEFNFSNVESSRAVRGLYDTAYAEYGAYFRTRLAKPRVSAFNDIRDISLFPEGD